MNATLGHRLPLSLFGSDTDYAWDPAAPRVELDDVSVHFGNVTALADVTTTFEKSQFIGVVGPNGAGKTTLLRTISAVLRPNRGMVRIQGVDTTDLSSRAVSRQVAVVPQDTSIAFDFNVREIVQMARTPYLGRFSRADDADTTAVENAMHRTDVARFAERSISEVSGGERQRVMLSRALAQETPVLLLDEPTASLDINHQIQTLELIRGLVGEGKTAIAAIHDLNLAARYCDELVLLDAGRVVSRGRPETVLTEDDLSSVFQTNAVVTRHPVTGSILVTTLR